MFPQYYFPKPSDGGLYFQLQALQFTYFELVYDSIENCSTKMEGKSNIYKLILIRV